MLSGISNTGVKPNMSRETKFATMLAASVETQKKRENGDKLLLPQRGGLQLVH